MKRTKVLIGLKVGRISVIEKDNEKSAKLFFTKTGKKFHKLYFKCLCDCGNFLSVRSDVLIGKKKTRSCGCLQKESARRCGKEAGLPFGDAPLNLLIGSYKKNARLRNIEYGLSRDEFIKLINQNCYYCNRKPESIKRAKQNPNVNFITYNGIDRLNNNDGYVLKNCVSCCSNCNYGKSDLNYADYLEEIEKTFFHRIFPFYVPEKIKKLKLLCENHKDSEHQTPP